MSPYLESFHDYLERSGKSPHTITAYTRDATAFVAWWEQSTGDRFLPRVIDSRDVVNYRAFLQQRGKAPATINRQLNALRKFFKWARLQDPAVEDPFDILENVFIKQQKDTAPRWLGHKEQAALIRAVRKRGSNRDLAIVRILLGAGLRISELVSLNLEACTAHTLRHSFGKNLVDAGTPLDQVVTLLGHESLNTTQVYVRPSRKDLEKAVRQAAGEL